MFCVFEGGLVGAVKIVGKALVTGKAEGLSERTDLDIVLVKLIREWKGSWYFYSEALR